MKGDIEAPLTELKKCNCNCDKLGRQNTKVYNVNIQDHNYFKGKDSKIKTKKLVELLTEGVLGQCVS